VRQPTYEIQRNATANQLLLASPARSVHRLANKWND